MKILAYVLGLLLIAAGIMHFINPNFYLPFIPGFIPFKTASIYLSGLIEVILGIGLFLPAYKKNAALGLTALMVFFLFIHIWDATKEIPAIGNHTVAYLRIAIQLVLIGLFWKLSKD